MSGKTPGQGAYFANCGRSRRSAPAILDIFEGAQQIQQLIVARRLLGKTSAELK
jgi:hypothetical protein